MIAGIDKSIISRWLDVSQNPVPAILIIFLLGLSMSYIGVAWSMPEDILSTAVYFSNSGIRFVMDSPTDLSSVNLQSYTSIKVPFGAVQYSVGVSLLIMFFGISYTLSGNLSRYDDAGIGTVLIRICSVFASWFRPQWVASKEAKATWQTLNGRKMRYFFLWLIFAGFDTYTGADFRTTQGGMGMVWSIIVSVIADNVMGEALVTGGLSWVIHAVSFAYTMIYPSQTKPDDGEESEMDIPSSIRNRRPQPPVAPSVPPIATNTPQAPRIVRPTISGSSIARDPSYIRTGTATTNPNTGDGSNV